MNGLTPLVLTAVNGRRFCKTFILEETLLSIAMGPYWLLTYESDRLTRKLDAEDPSRTRWVFARTTYEDDFTRGYGQPGLDPVCDALMADVPR